MKMALGAAEGVGVALGGTSVAVDVDAAVRVGDNVADDVAVAATVRVGDSVDVGCGEAVALALGFGVAVGEGVAVPTACMLGVGVEVAAAGNVGPGVFSAPAGSRVNTVT